MRDVLCIGVLSADGCDTCISGFAGFGESIVAGVEVLAFLGGRVRDVRSIEQEDYTFNLF